jgi:anti-sigma B factor antagonist
MPDSYRQQGAIVDTWRGLQLTLTDQHGRRVAAVAGEVDLATANALYVFLANCIYGAASPSDLVVDLSAVTFMGASGLTVLVRADGLARDLGVRLRLGAASECVTRVLQVTGLSARFMPSPVGPLSIVGTG